MEKKIDRKKIERLKYLKLMLVKYAHRYYDSGYNLSPRMYNWVDEYNDIKDNNPDEWDIFCKETNSCSSHDAYDLFA